MKSLKEICRDIAEVEGGLMEGWIQFRYDRLLTVMGAGHPADILDDILAPVFWPVQSGEEVSISDVSKLYYGLLEFKSGFDVAELIPMINDLKEYLQSNGAAVGGERIKHEELKKRYVGKTLDKEKFRKAGDVWNLEVKDGHFIGHYYWNNERHRYFDEFSIAVDENMTILGIERLQTSTADGGYINPCRYTLVHNGEFDKLLKAATE